MDAKRIRIETENFNVQLVERTWKTKSIKPRVYVGGEVDVDFTEAYEMQRSNGYAAKGTNPDEDRLFAKLNRQVVKNQKAVVEEAIAEVERLAGLADAKLSFSRTAGCGCGCSPAFVASPDFGKSNRAYSDIFSFESIFITKKTAE